MTTGMANTAEDMAKFWGQNLGGNMSAATANFYWRQRGMAPRYFIRAGPMVGSFYSIRMARPGLTFQLHNFTVEPQNPNACLGLCGTEV